VMSFIRKRIAEATPKKNPQARFSTHWVLDRIGQDIHDERRIFHHQRKWHSFYRN
jgi:hypothetical protein